MLCMLASINDNDHFILPRQAQDPKQREGNLERKGVSLSLQGGMAGIPAHLISGLSNHDQIAADIEAFVAALAAKAPDANSAEAKL
jgi:hypothetical protein